jgi:hypothetical protein
VRRASDRVVEVSRILGGGGVNTRCARRALESCWRTTGTPRNCTRFTGGRR